MVGKWFLENYYLGSNAAIHNSLQASLSVLELPEPEAYDSQTMLIGPFSASKSYLRCKLTGIIYFFAFIYLQAAAEPADLLSFLAEGLNLSISET